MNENVKKKDLTDVFSTYGEILDIMMKGDFAFIEFVNVEAATKAVIEMNGAKLRGSKIVVEAAKLKEGQFSRSRDILIS